MENPIQMDDLGVPLFLETSMYLLLNSEKFPALAMAWCTGKKNWKISLPRGTLGAGALRPACEAHGGIVDTSPGKKWPLYIPNDNYRFFSIYINIEYTYIVYIYTVCIYSVYIYIQCIYIYIVYMYIYIWVSLT